jgi:betaine lipid synthase
MAKYSKASCPTYLTESAFSSLSTSDALSSIRIHTDSIVNVLNTSIEDSELTCVVVMDHLDWFTDEMAHEEISALAPKMKSGGKVYWRSAGKVPWYNPIFKEYGFEVRPIRIRNEEDPCIDRVNMYASFWWVLGWIGGLLLLPLTDL